MIINYIPFRPVSDGRVTPTTAYVEGEVLMLNGEAVDLSLIPDDTMLPLTAINNELFGGPIIRRNGRLELTLKLAIEADAPDFMWVDGRVEVENGDVPFPVAPYRRESELDLSSQVSLSPGAINIQSFEEKDDV